MGVSAAGRMVRYMNRDAFVSYAHLMCEHADNSLTTDRCNRETMAIESSCRIFLFVSRAQRCACTGDTPHPSVVSGARQQLNTNLFSPGRRDNSSFTIHVRGPSRALSSFYRAPTLSSHFKTPHLAPPITTTTSRAAAARAMQFRSSAARPC